MDRTKTILTLTLVTALLLLAACGGNDDNAEAEGGGEITVQDLVGTWRTDEPSYAQFNEDGSYSLAFSIEGLEDSPVEEGQFTLEGTLFTFISAEESASCPPGARGKYEMEVLGEDRIRQVKVEDECGIRGSTGDVTIERVS